MHDFMKADASRNLDRACDDAALALRPFFTNNVNAADAAGIQATTVPQVAKIIHDSVEPRVTFLARRLTNIVKWLEANEPDVFRRGLWDCIDNE